MILVALLLLCFPLMSQGAVTNSWEQWLDSAYQLTWLDQKDIDNWINANEDKAFNKKLVSFADDWEKRLSGRTGSAEFGSFPDTAYRHLAIAQMLLYLRSSEPARLEKALAAVDQEYYKSKLEFPLLAFWYYYIRAHYNLENGNSDEFVSDIYHIWIDVVLKLESAKYEMGPSGSLKNLRGFYQSIPYLYKNLANLILRKAIVRRRMSNIDALGVIIWNLSQRMPPKGYGQWIEHITKRIYGPESDDFHLAFTVLYMEAEKYRQTAEDLIDSAKDKAAIERRLISALDNYEFLYGLAQTRHGKAAATTKHLYLTSFVLSRLYEKGPKQSFIASIPLLKRKAGKAWHESKSFLPKGIKLFEELSATLIYKTDWQKNGFIQRKTYVAEMHELWRAIMNLCMDTGIYYEKFVDPEHSDSLKQNIPLLEKALTHYLTFFDDYAAKGYLDIVPDNAFFGAVEAAERLSKMHFLTGSWEREGVSNYDLSRARRVQAAEIFPFDVNHYYLLAKQLADLDRLELYKKSVFLLAYRVRNSKSIAEAAKNKVRFMGKDLLVMQQVMPEIILRAADGIVLQEGIDSIPLAISQRIDAIEKELKQKAQEYMIDAGKLKKIRKFSKSMKAESASTSFSKKETVSLLKDLIAINITLKNLMNTPIETKQNPNDVQFVTDIFSENFQQLYLDLKQIEEESSLLVKLPDTHGMRETMVLEIDHPLHTLLRRFYHEYSRENFNYLRLLKGQQPVEPISLYMRYSPTLKRLTREQMKKNKTY